MNKKVKKLVDGAVFISSLEIEEKVENKETIKVSSCGECPFHEVDYDDFSTGNDTLEICQLARFKNMKDYFIDCYDTKSHKRRKKTPNTPLWCPLKNKLITVELEEK